jgi:DNA helicase HerA-like ATPase
MTSSAEAKQEHSTSVDIGSSEGKRILIDVMRLVDTRMLIQANSGGGKSWLLRLIAEQAAGQMQTIILDPEGEFATLRERVDMVLVGREGEIAADTRSASLLARKLVEIGVSAVIDLYDLHLSDRRRYVKLFLEALMNVPRSLWHPMLIVLDECHIFAPERSAGDAESTQAVIALMSQGRKRGFAGILSTQRLSKLHKDAAAEANNVVIGRTWLDTDQKRAGDMLGMNNTDRQRLRDLGEGEFFAFGPALSTGGVARFQSGQVKTTHPHAGERHKIVPPKASGAIQQIVSQIGDLPAQAEEEARTVEELRQKVLALQRELRTRDVKPVQPDQSVIERAMREAAQRLQAEHSRQVSELELEIARLRRTMQGSVDSLSQALRVEPPKIERTVVAPKAAPPRPAPRLDGELQLSKTQQRILDALAWYESIGITEPSNLQIGAVALIDATGGHFSNTVGPLSSQGLIERRQGAMRLTDAGRAFASVPDKVATLADYHDVLRSRVGRARSASSRTVEILNAIIAAGGSEMTAEEIGRAVGIDHTGGHFSNSIGPLGTLGLIERSRGIVRPTEILFPPGLD